MAKTLAKKIAVMQAAERGEKIEVRNLNQIQWTRTNYPHWNWVDFDYRVAPKPQKFWVLFDINGRVITSGTENPPDSFDPSCNLEWYERSPDDLSSAI